MEMKEKEAEKKAAEQNNFLQLMMQQQQENRDIQQQLQHAAPVHATAATTVTGPTATKSVANKSFRQNNSK